MIQNQIRFLPLYFLLPLWLLHLSAAGQENVYLRTDRDIYIAGEDIFISANCLYSGTADSSELSKIVYTELINNDKTPVQQTIIKLNQGMGTACVTIPDSLQTANYTLRGYTRWMRNYKSDFFFQKNISIINPFAADPFPTKSTAYQKDTLIFYAEADSILVHQENKIIIQALDKYGNPKKIKGYLLSPLQDTLHHVTTSEKGLYTLTFNPSTAGNYIFHYKADHITRAIPLPAINNSGTNLVLKNTSGSQVKFLIQNNNSALHQKKGQLHLTTAKGDILRKYPVSINDGLIISIDKKDLAKGFLCARLLNQKNDVLSARYFSAFSWPENPIQISLDKNSYSYREKVTASISKPSNLSQITVSVVKKALLNQYYIPFTGHPNNYPTKTFNQYLAGSYGLNDLLCCFTPYYQVFDDQPSIAYLPEPEAQIISGTIINPTTLEPIKNEVWISSIVDTIAQIDIFKSDSLGEFHFISNHYGIKDLVIQPIATNNHTHYHINTNPVFSNRYHTIAPSPLFLSKAKAIELNSAIQNVQIDRSYQADKLYSIQTLSVPKKQSFYGEPNTSTTLSRYIDLYSTEEVIREIIPTVGVRMQKNNYKLVVSEETTYYQTQGEIFSMVDGTWIKDAKRILNINPKELRKTEVINLNYYYQGYKLGRMVHFFTTKGDLSALDFDSDIFRQSYPFCTPPVQLTNPNYSVDSILTSSIPDFRNLLYYQNNLSNDTFNFYTADESTSYFIVLEGINQDGIMEQTITEFDVKP